MTNLSIEERLIEIENRNKRVEAEKSWETSPHRKILIVVTTYLVMCLTMSAIGIKDFYMQAIIPTTGYFLSTLSFGFIKKYYLESQLNKK